MRLPRNFSYFKKGMRFIRIADEIIFEIVLLERGMIRLISLETTPTNFESTALLEGFAIIYIRCICCDIEVDFNVTSPIYDRVLRFKGRICSQCKKNCTCKDSCKKGSIKIIR